MDWANSFGDAAHSMVPREDIFNESYDASGFASMDLSFDGSFQELENTKSSSLTFDTPKGEDLDRTQGPTESRSGQELLRLLQQPDPSAALLGSTAPRVAIATQLSGKFFVAESPWAGTSMSSRPPELTCYRRNSFKVYGTVVLPHNLSLFIHNNGQLRKITGLSAQVLALDNVDGRSIKVISVPPRSVSNSYTMVSEVEPRIISLGVDLETNYLSGPSSIVVSWDRLQFRNATAKNYRRASAQQLYRLDVVVVAALSDGTNATIARAKSTPIVVRGSSPRNYQSRNDSTLQAKAIPTTSLRQGTDALPERGQYEGFTIDEKCPTPNALGSSGLAPLLDGVNVAHGPEYGHRDDINLNAIRRNDIQQLHLHSFSSVDNQARPSPAIFPENGDNNHRHRLSISASQSLTETETRAAPTPEYVIEDDTLTYEYYPLSIDDWTVPIEAIYRPHYIHQQETGAPDRVQNNGQKRFYKR